MSPGTTYVTKLRTKIVQAMDYVLQCDNDQMALNGWRQLCSHGFALVNLAHKEGKLEPLGPVWIEMAELLLKEWPPKSSEATKTSVEGNRVRCNFDHFDVVVPVEHLQIGLDSLKRESDSCCCDRLMSYWGRCYSVILAVNYLNLEDEIEIPIQLDGRYTDKNLSSDTQSRRLPQRQIGPTRPK